MTDQSHIINAYHIKGDGYGRLLQGDDIAKVIRDDALAWVHLDANNPQSRRWLEREITYLDKIILDALLAEETRPRIMEFDKGALLILRGVNLNENSSPEDMISIRLWIDEHRIISLQKRPLRAVKGLKEALEQGKGPKDSGDFISDLTAKLFEKMEPIFSDLDERLDDIEEKIIDEPDITERAELTLIRKQAIIFRRYIAPQRDVMMYLRASELSWIRPADKRQMQESLDRVTRYTEDLDAIRERSQIVKDELANILSDKMNKNMYVLSVIAAIFLPLGFFTGLMGINIGGMPGVESDDAFWLFSGVLALLVLFQVVLFKKLKWF